MKMNLKECKELNDDDDDGYRCKMKLTTVMLLYIIIMIKVIYKLTCCVVARTYFNKSITCGYQNKTFI